MSEGSSKYDPLGSFLAKIDKREISLSLAEISELVGGLPMEANRNQFWANVANHHDARRRQWLNNGYRAFFDKSQSRVRFTKDYLEDVGRSDAPWSDQELRACVVAYRKLWEAEQIGQKLNK
jgi:hypothetical protein